MMISMTHNENIKTFDDLSQHLELEVERLEAYKAIKAAKSGSAYMVNNDSRTLRGFKRKIMVQDNTLAMDVCVRRQRTPNASKEIVVVRAKMANASIVTRRDTLLITTLS